MEKSRIKMEGQLAEDFSNMMQNLTAMAEENGGMEKLLKDTGISWEDYEEIKEYLYDKYKVVTFI